MTIHRHDPAITRVNGTGGANLGTASAATGDTAAGRADDPDAIRRDIERTRAELGDTVEALASKAHVTDRLRGRAAGAGRRARDRASAAGERVGAAGQRISEVAPGALGRTPGRGLAPLIGAGLAAAVVGALLVRRRARSGRGGRGAGMARHRPERARARRSVPAGPFPTGRHAMGRLASGRYGAVPRAATLPTAVRRMAPRRMAARRGPVRRGRW
ncbi:DUF3618 domain-containing protein [Allostreptomyces psammosilenae]|uniref:DUF3618 domain-containing protein n=1 Tax=Allostreptomyces psammosilenae TaxID=1892865 RepID=A0A852ZTS4_9ACTN|nr:DUF3618 domain-containing protein [Allostreptomyces psammosilenae]NYI04174.1 hypothetical protein [Allostreptomyces psammosilenae]